LRRKVSDREKHLARQNTMSRRAEAAASLERLRKGDVIAVESGRRSGLAVVIDPGLDPLTEPRPLVVTEDRWAGRLSVTDFPAPVRSLGRLRLPKQVDVRSPRSRRELADSLRNAGIAVPGRQRRRTNAADDPELAALRRALRAHPCHGCEQREDHARWAERHHRLAAENEQLKQRMAATTHSLARSFDRIRTLLTERGYLTRGADQDVTSHGRRLARLYSESDLLAAECLREGVWRGLEPAELAAVVSALVYEARRDGPAEVRVPAGPIGDALAGTARLWASIEEDERRHRLDTTREPDAGFAWPVYRWSRGEPLERVLTAAEANGQELLAGDFVRWCRQVIDLLEQIRDVVRGDDPVGAVAGRAAAAIRRGVVAMGTV
jgi:ATP-dependent RNA helicase HelY